MDKGERPSSNGPKSSLFRVSKDSRGNWVVHDRSGLCAGLFVDRAEALKFAMFENGNRPQAVIMVPELDMSAKPHTVQPSTANARAPLRRRRVVLPTATA